MSAAWDIEIRPEAGLTPVERAQARDSYVRDFERQFKDWQGIAACCLSVDRDGDWRLLGFESFKAWLHDAAPASERYLYLAMGLWKELSVDIPEDILNTIPIGTAAILQRQVKSPKLRRDSRVLAAAKNKPKKFVEELRQIAPDQHVEGIVRKVVEFTESQWSVVEATYEKYQVMLDPNASFAAFIEFLCAEISEWTLHAEKKDQGRENDPDRARVH
jgi:hypothetical protein